MATQRFYDGQPGPDIRRELNNFEAILDGTVAAAQDASTAATSASVKAQQWADAAPGVEVETGKYSAKHWADRAQTTVTGGLIYRGSHSAASGAYPATPSLGDYYKISAAGTLGGVEYSVGDSIIYNGTGWDKIDSTDAVTSVAGRVGAVVLTKADVGLGNVDNTSDANKPISTATQAALNGKANTTHTHAVADVTGLQSTLGTLTSHTGNTSNPHGVTKVQVGLGNVDNTSDANKPISSATQAALNTKEGAIASGTTTQYWRGDKTWRDFFTDVRAATLTGLSTATNAVVAATDTVLAAIGKLQAQVSAKFDKTGGDVAGNINFTGTGRRITGDFSNVAVNNRVMFQTSTSNANTVVQALPNGSGPGGFFGALNSSDTSNFSRLLMGISQTSASIESQAQGTGGVLPLTFWTNNAERLRIDSSGNVLVTSPAGLGYGAGAGGIVTQATSKSTSVTLNKPTGQVTMNNATLAAGAAIAFQLNNTLINGLDNVIVTPFNNNAYRVDMQTIFNGGCHIRVTNMTGGSLSEAFVINFAIIKGATS